MQFLRSPARVPAKSTAPGIGTSRAPTSGMTGGRPGLVPRHQFRPGDLLRIRSERWRLVAATVYDTHVALEVRGCDTGNAGDAAVFLSPADLVQPLTRKPEPRFVGTAAFRRRACRELADA